MPSLVLDSKILLARVNARIRLLRGWLAHDHGDAAYWWARETTASWAQAERATLRQVAHLLQVDHATRRARAIGPHADLEAQRAWLARYERHACRTAATYLRLPHASTLATLRAGEIVEV